MLPIGAALPMLFSPSRGVIVHFSLVQVPFSKPLAVSLVPTSVPASTVRTVSLPTPFPSILGIISIFVPPVVVPLVSPPSPPVVSSAQPYLSAATWSVYPAMVNPRPSPPSLGPRHALRSVLVDAYASPSPLRRSPSSLELTAAV